MFPQQLGVAKHLKQVKILIALDIGERIFANTPLATLVP